MKSNKSKGFSILAVILVIVAVIVGIGIWALSGQTNTSNYSENNLNIAVSALINDSATLKTEYDRIVINGGDPTKAADQNEVFIYNNVFTFALTLPVNNNIIKKDSNYLDQGYWLLGSVVGNNVGTVAPDPALVILGVKQDICKQINKNLYGTTNIPTTTISNPIASSGRNPIFYSPDISALTATSGWLQGCVGTDRGIDANMFFRIVAAK